MNAVVNEGKVGKAKAEVEMVTMTDGRVVAFTGEKRRMNKEYFKVGDGEPEHAEVLDKDGNALPDGTLVARFDFRNGETRLFVPSEELMWQFAGHGAIQKIGDETAVAKDMADIDDMLLDIDQLIERLNNGEWKTRRDGDGMAGTSVLLKALVELSGKSVEEIKTFLKPKSQAEKLALRNSAKVKPIVERIEAEKLSKGTKVNTDDMLADLGVEPNF